MHVHKSEHVQGIRTVLAHSINYCWQAKIAKFNSKIINYSSESEQRNKDENLKVSGILYLR